MASKNHKTASSASRTTGRRFKTAGDPVPVVRVQTGIRIESRILKVLKGVAEYLDLTVGDLLEGIVLHAFESKTPFSSATLQRITQLKDVYGLDLRAEHSHRLIEPADTNN